MDLTNSERGNPTKRLKSDNDSHSGNNHQLSQNLPSQSEISSRGVQAQTNALIDLKIQRSNNDKDWSLQTSEIKHLRSCLGEKNQQNPLLQTKQVCQLST